MSARTVRAAPGAALLLAAGIAAAAAPATPELAFVSCPIVRDTRTVPCWLTEYRGELYYIGIQTDVSAPFNPPSLGHRMLVEGRVKEGPRICGGIVIEPATISILQERDDACRVQLPSEDAYQLPFEPPRPPGPSKGRLAFDTGGAPPPPPAPPYRERSFTVPYDFDAMVGFKTPRFLTPIVQYAQLANAARVEITGYRGATRLSDGTLLEESAPMAKRRAEQVAELLKGTGLTQPEYQVRWKDAAETGGPDRRRVEVLVRPR